MSTKAHTLTSLHLTATPYRDSIPYIMCNVYHHGDLVLQFSVDRKMLRQGEITIQSPSLLVRSSLRDLVDNMLPQRKIRIVNRKRKRGSKSKVKTKGRR